jgi:hypothetical protein
MSIFTKLTCTFFQKYCQRFSLPSRISPKNIQDPRSQDPDFLELWLEQGVHSTLLFQSCKCLFVWLSNDHYTEEATTSKTSESLKSNPVKKRKIWSKLKSGFYGLKLGTGQRVANNHQRTRHKITFNLRHHKNLRNFMQILLIFLISRNGRSQPVVGVWVGKGWGEKFYEYVREIAIEILSKKIKIKIFENYYLIHAFWWKLRAFRAGESEVTCGQWILKLMPGYINSKTQG